MNIFEFGVLNYFLCSIGSFLVTGLVLYILSIITPSLADWLDAILNEPAFTPFLLFLIVGWWIFDPLIIGIALFTAILCGFKTLITGVHRDHLREANKKK